MFDVEVLAVAATNHVISLKQNDEAKSSFIIEKTVRKLQGETRPFLLYLLSARFLHSDPKETKTLHCPQKMENLTSICILGDGSSAKVNEQNKVYI